MADVVRFARNIEEVVYTVGPDSVRQAILGWLSDEHSAAFLDTTTVRLCEGGSIAVTTRFDAQGTEARRAETGEDTGSVHDGPVGDSRCAQTPASKDQP